MKATRMNRMRQAMTLVEILIAISILAVGMMCICSLLPLGIRNTAVSVDKTVAASVAKSAIESMKHYSFDLTVMENGDSTTYGSLAGNLLTPGAGGSFVVAIYNYHQKGIAGELYPTGRILGIFGTGASSPGGFMVPADVELPLVLRGGAVTNPADYVRFPDNPEYGWTATLLPTVIEDDDDDNRSDEDTWQAGVPFDADSDGNTDDLPQYTDTSSYYAQIAIWRVTGTSLEIKEFNYGLTANIKNGSEIILVQNSDEGTQFLKAVKPGDYLARTYHHIWYQIAGVDAQNRKVMLAKKYYTPYLELTTEATGAGPILLASRYKLVALYNTVITP